MLDDYGIEPGGTRAVDEFLADHPELTVEESTLAHRPCIIRKP